MALDDREERQFWEFVAARRQHLVRTAYLLTGDHGHAEDFVQDALIRAHRNWRRIEQTDQPEAYVRKIVANLVVSWWRRALRHRTHVAWEFPDLPDGRDDHAAVEHSDELWRALSRLPPGMRTVVVLRYYEELTEAETAAVLGKSLGTVKSQASRGLARMRELLAEDASDPPGAADAAARNPSRIPASPGGSHAR